MHFGIILAVTVAGYLGMTWWVAALAATMLTLATLRDDFGLSERFVRLGTLRVLSLAMIISFANNLTFSAIAWFVGRGIGVVTTV